MAQKILLIDENPQMLTLIGDYLSNLGYEVHRARECDEAMALLKNYQYSLVITGTDWENLGGSGNNLTQYIKKLTYQPRIVRLEETHSTPCANPEPCNDSTLVIEKPLSLLLLGNLMHEITSI